MKLSAIVAITENRVIGRNNRLPWRLPADLCHFKKLTLGKPILMGRKTYESIGRVLPGRRNLILTRNSAYQVPGAEVVFSLEEAVSGLKADEELMLIGGAELFREFLPRVQKVYLTLVRAELEGDSYFPELSAAEWREVSREDHGADAENEYDYSFTVWERG